MRRRSRADAPPATVPFGQHPARPTRRLLAPLVCQRCRTEHDTGALRGDMRCNRRLECQGIHSRIVRPRTGAPLQPQGILLLSGVTGSGKSTTIAAMLDLVNEQKPVHIVTIEDPIEFVYEQDRCIINQREVGRDAKSFSSALRAVLREDVNVVLLGELRDLDTISTAMTAAETGHLIFATLHTNSAYSTINLSLIHISEPTRPY